MITENGAVKTSTPITEQVQKELNKSAFILSIIYIVIGAVMLVLGFLIYVSAGDYYGFVPLFCGAILCALGIVLVVNHQNLKNNTLKNKKVDEVEFYRDHVMLYEYTDGELTTTSKIYYKWILRIKETPNYLFLFNTRATAVAVDKNTLPVNELNTVRMLLGRPVVAAAAQASAQGGQGAGPDVKSATTVEVPPEEPFADMTDNKEE